MSMASEQQKRMMKASTISSGAPAVCQRRILDRTDGRLAADRSSVRPHWRRPNPNSRHVPRITQSDSVYRDD